MQFELGSGRYALTTENEMTVRDEQSLRAHVNNIHSLCQLRIDASFFGAQLSKLRAA